MVIFSFQLDQPRAIAVDPRKLLAQLRIFLAHIEQVDIVADDR